MERPQQTLKIILWMTDQLGNVYHRYLPFARYAFSGGTATLTHYLLLMGQVEVLEFNEIASTTIAYFISAVLHYLILYYWVFKSTEFHSKTLFRFCMFVFISLALNTLIFTFFLEILKLWYLFAQLITTLIVLFFSYFMNSRFTFGQR